MELCETRRNKNEHETDLMKRYMLLETQYNNEISTVESDLKQYSIFSNHKKKVSEDQQKGEIEKIRVRLFI